MNAITTASGTTRRLPADLSPHRVAGLDAAGRIVVDDFDARNADPMTVGGYTQQPSMFGLTLCCDASDKGTEDGVCCRACYGTKPNADEGWYLFRRDGVFPELDPVVSFRLGIPGRPHPIDLTLLPASDNLPVRGREYGNFVTVSALAADSAALPIAVAALTGKKIGEF